MLAKFFQNSKKNGKYYAELERDYAKIKSEMKQIENDRDLLRYLTILLSFVENNTFT